MAKNFKSPIVASLWQAMSEANKSHAENDEELWYAADSFHDNSFKKIVDAMIVDAIVANPTEEKLPVARTDELRTLIERASSLHDLDRSLSNFIDVVTSELPANSKLVAYLNERMLFTIKERINNYLRITKDMVSEPTFDNDPPTEASGKILEGHFGKHKK